MTASPRPFDVCVVGSANLDLVASTPRLPRPGETVLGEHYAEHPGGKGVNQAVAAARAGARTAFVGAVGSDAAGGVLRRVMDAEGIDVASLAVVQGTPTGRALIGVAADGANSIIVVPGANGAVDRTSVERAGAITSAAVVLAQLEIPLDVVGLALMSSIMGCAARCFMNCRWDPITLWA